MSVSCGLCGLCVPVRACPCGPFFRPSAVGVNGAHAVPSAVGVKTWRSAPPWPPNKRVPLVKWAKGST
eukprot:1277741-Prymnesium_polylepis.1